MNIFHKKLLNLCLANCSRYVSNFAMLSRLLGAPTVFTQGCSPNVLETSRSSNCVLQGVFCKVFLKILQNSQEISCLLESLVQVFFCEIWEIFYKHLFHTSCSCFWNCLLLPNITIYLIFYSSWRLDCLKPDYWSFKVLSFLPFDVFISIRKMMK